ncbi:MAG: hypothetical protein JSU72_00895 [Deltaproteobacteria bacterium]|nr:MAG: hypothetical protein JSU72_00895 [Deltaproteobacteria bacterium]
MVSSRDDPAEPRWMFEEVVAAADDSTRVASYETNRGGHFGFDIAYGKDDIGQIIRLMLDPEVLRAWNRRPESCKGTVADNSTGWPKGGRLLLA